MRLAYQKISQRLLKANMEIIRAYNDTLTIISQDKHDGEIQAEIRNKQYELSALIAKIQQVKQK